MNFLRFLGSILLIKNDRLCPAGIVVISGAFFICILIFSSGHVQGQSMEPRAYSNTPVGMNFFLLGYVYQGGDVLLDPSLPVQDVNIQIHSPFVAYARALDVFGKSGKIEIVVPYALLSGTGTFQDQTRDRKVSGFGDPAVRFSVNLYGAPALSFKEFQKYQQDMIIGVSLLVTAPLGQYDSSRLANIGSNRWAFKPEVGISKALGSWTLEVATAATFYTNNNSFLSNHTREQDPVYSMQGHVIYNFQSGIWAGLDATYYTGGRTSIDGEKNDDLQKSWRMGATVSLPVSIRNSIKLYASTGIQARSGGDFDILGIAWQYRWGGGL